MGARDAVIVGIGWSDYPVAPELDAMDHHVLALRRALADCGIEKSEIDGYACAGTASSSMTRRPWPSTCGSTTGGWTAPRSAVRASSSTCSTPPRPSRPACAMSSWSPTGRTCCRAWGGGWAPAPSRPARARVRGPAQFESPWGNVLAGSYAMAARRHMHEFGTTPEQLAEIAVGVREFAGLNPLAQYRDPITVDDVLNSRLIADPLHKLDCCVISDGGGAFIMTTKRTGSRSGQASRLRAGRGGGRDPLERSARCPTSRPRPPPSAGPRPSGAPVCGPRTSTRSRSTTASPSPCCCSSRTWGSARKGRAAASSRPACSGGAGANR
jgi:hypothetical protein